MERMQKPRIIAFMVVAFLAVSSSSFGQTGITRHQRIADSILRRKAASAAVASAKMGLAMPDKAPVKGAIGVAQDSTGFDLPPSPTGIEDDINALLQSTDAAEDTTPPDITTAPETTPDPEPSSPPAFVQPSTTEEVAPSDSAELQATPLESNEALSEAAPITEAPGAGFPADAYPASSYPMTPEPVTIPEDVSVQSYGDGYETVAPGTSAVQSTITHPDGSYPTTPHQPLMVPADASYEDPFATAVTSPVYSDTTSVVPPAANACGECASGGAACAPSCNSPCGGCGTCGGCGSHWITTLTAFGGVHGFKNGVNRATSGSFGFQEGFNVASPFDFNPYGMQSQIGLRATQTDFNGSNFTTDSRTQLFVTAGLFKRNYAGWQGGFVVDYLLDEWYTSLNLAQLRGELSYGVASGSSVGFMFTTNLLDDDSTSTLNGTTVNDEWGTLDYYAFFYEVQSNQHRRGTWRVWVGMTGESDGIIGSDFKIPLAGTWSIEPEFTYVVPDEATGAGANAEEAWNVGVNLVWYPGRALGDMNIARLPMFDVAGNGSMIVRRD